MRSRRKHVDGVVVGKYLRRQVVRQIALLAQSKAVRREQGRKNDGNAIAAILLIERQKGNGTMLRRSYHMDLQRGKCRSFRSPAAAGVLCCLLYSVRRTGTWRAAAYHSFVFVRRPLRSSDELRRESTQQVRAGSPCNPADSCGTPCERQWGWSEKRAPQWGICHSPDKRNIENAKELTLRPAARDGCFRDTVAQEAHVAPANLIRGVHGESR